MSETLPVRQLVLYKHGVGFVQRRGSVHGRDLPLQFARKDMDDVLKSLLVTDRGGGKVLGFSYDGAEDVQERIHEKALVPPEKEALLGLLRQLPGCRVRVRTTASETVGDVVGTEEAELIAGGDVALPNPKVLLREDSGAIVPVPLRELLSLDLVDARTSQDLQYYLRLVASERQREQRGLTVYLEGEEHQLEVAYLTSAPSWRVTYRLDHRAQETVLQAWGVVDNWLDEDLKEVNVSLVAGKPISFVYDVYVPRTVQRPVVQEEVRALEGPVELEAASEALDDSGVGEVERAAEKKEAGPARRRAAPMPAMAPAAFASAANFLPGQSPPGAPPAPRVGGSARVDTVVVEGGEFSRYDIRTPLTVLRGQSAMVPILEAPVRARRELVYNGAKVPRNPVAILRWRNDTGVLERGPTLVLEDGTYAGEGIVPYTSRDGEVQVPFAVELGVEVTEENVPARRTVDLQLDRTWARQEVRSRLTTTYTVQNRKTETIHITLEQPRLPGWELKDAPKPDEELPDLRRFRLEVKAKTRAVLSVAQERLEWVSQSTGSFGPAALDAVLGEGGLSTSLVACVKALLLLHQEKARLERDLERLQQTRTTLSNEQSRVRTNLASVVSTQNKALQQRYTEQLQGLEDRLSKLLEEEDRLRARRGELDQRMDQQLDAWPSRPANASSSGAAG